MSAWLFGGDFLGYAFRVSLGRFKRDAGPETRVRDVGGTSPLLWIQGHPHIGSEPSRGDAGNGKVECLWHDAQ